jgi:hypothetical protein
MASSSPPRSVGEPTGVGATDFGAFGAPEGCEVVSVGPGGLGGGPGGPGGEDEELGGLWDTAGGGGDGADRIYEGALGGGELILAGEGRLEKLLKEGKDGRVPMEGAMETCSMPPIIVYVCVCVCVRVCVRVYMHVCVRVQRRA